MEKQKFKSLLILKYKEENMITDGYESADCFNNYFASVFCEEDIEDLPTCELKTTIKCIDPTFNEQVIRTKLNSLNTNKSTRVDKVHPNVLKECSGSLVKPLFI